MAARNQIETTLNTLLAADSFDDYGPNGLQIEGAEQVSRIVSGVRKPKAPCPSRSSAARKSRRAATTPWRK